MRKDLCFLLIIFVKAYSNASFAQHSATISPIKSNPPQDVSKVNLGKELYNEQLFSVNYANSCNSCHNIRQGGVDRLARYLGINNKPGAMNTPTVFNANLNFRQFWNGRAKNFDEVIEDHLKDPTIFNNNWPQVIKRIHGTPKLKKQFDKIYSKSIQKDDVKDALICYLNTLSTPNSLFDQYLLGNAKALPPKALKGYALFNSYGCVTCHQGPNIGGNLYQKLGIYKPYYVNPNSIQPTDLGLYQITGKEEDKFVFKVPSLRNITATGPYLHDGSVRTLPEVVQIMGIYQIGEPIPPYDVDLIVEYLKTLTGNWPQE